MAAQPPRGRDDGYLGFVGVSTGQSSMMQIFPAWAGILGLPTATLVGYDVPLDAAPGSYRDLLTRIRDDPRCHGALVTTHKMRLYRACADLFDEIDEFGRAAGEVSSISKRNGRLRGHAKDALTVGLAMEEFWPADGFAAGAHAVCLGAGGAGTALTAYLARRTDRPSKIVVTGRMPQELDHLTALHDTLGTPTGVLHLVLEDSGDGGITADLLRAAPWGSLVVNATGLGKDRPGSPVPDGAAFPRGAYAWEFNYRGTLEFLHQARIRATLDQLSIHDGWRYFIHGWTQVIAEVFDIALTAELVDELSEAAVATTR
jgi:shikimate dehydrogenase